MQRDVYRYNEALSVATRPVNGPGSFNADAPYIWAIHTPFGGCYYN